MTLLTFLILLTGCALHRPWDQAFNGGEPVVIEPGDGAGNVRLGMRQGQVKRRIGEPDRAEVFPSENSTFWTWPSQGLSLQFAGRKLNAMFFYSGVKGGYETRDYKPFPGRTPEGITVYSNVAQVMGAYGSPDEAGELADAPIPARWFTYDNGVGFTFLAAGDKMVYVYLMKP